MTKDEFEAMKQTDDFIFAVDDEHVVINKVDHIRTMGKLPKSPDNYLVKRYYVVSKTTKVIVINQLASGKTFVEEISNERERDWMIKKGEIMDFELADDTSLTVDPSEIAKMMRKDKRKEKTMSSEDYIFVVRGENGAEPTYGYMYLESEAKRFCDAPGADYHYDRIDALNPDVNYEIKENKYDKVYVVFEEEGSGEFKDIGYTPEMEEAMDYLRKHSHGNMFIEELVYLCPNDYGNMTEFLNKMVEEYEDDGDC
jgi:hypothetical protein